MLRNRPAEYLRRPDPSAESGRHPDQLLPVRLQELPPVLQGPLQVREKMPSAKLVFIEPPSMDVLESRLRGRGTEAEDVIALRMKNAETELALKNEYDISFINDDLDECADALVAYIEQSAEEKDE